MLRRIYRSPNPDMLLNGYYDQPMGQQNGFIQEPQYNTDQGCINCGEYGVPNQDAGIPSDGNFQQDFVQQNPEQTVQEFYTEAPVDVPVSQKAVPNGGRNRPSINFFPVSFGGGRSSGRSDGFSGGTVAIANSFSTGRKGVATSNANAFADPSALTNENSRIQTQY